MGLTECWSESRRGRLWTKAKHNDLMRNIIPLWSTEEFSRRKIEASISLLRGVEHFKQDDLANARIQFEYAIEIDP
jgi:hypothetical protein